MCFSEPSAGKSRHIRGKKSAEHADYGSCQHITGPVHKEVTTLPPKGEELPES